MASTRSIRQGQIEIGILEHSGLEYAAYGYTLCGREITAYVKYKKGHYWLTTWSGTILAWRSEIVERYWNGGLALLFRLPKGKFIIGYALGNDMLFRGELIEGCSQDEAHRHCVMVAENWMEVDQMDEEAELAEA